MTEEEYQKAKARIEGVTLARVAAVIIGVNLAIGGNWVGAGTMAIMVALLHFALPVNKE